MNEHFSVFIYFAIAFLQADFTHADRQLASMSTNVQSALASCKRFFDFLDAENEEPDEATESFERTAGPSRARSPSRASGSPTSPRTRS
ncbi:MAG: hypothetical protein IIY17_02040 [Aeriscardovia sp.]|nr:hypothetical protein [Aeriscardovia sp.]